MSNRIKKLSAAVLLLSAAVVMFAWEGMAMTGEKQDKEVGVRVDLPAAAYDSDTSLESALRSRRSCRRFAQRSLALQSVAQLLWAGQGITDERGFRTAPSAGALYPLKIYLVAGRNRDLAEGVYHYRPAKHDLVRVKAEDARSALSRAALSQPAVKEAAAVFVITSVMARITGKYGKRGVAYAYMEAGHVAQNILLETESLGLGAVPIGAFDNAAVSRVLGLDKKETPIYLIPVGHPASSQEK